MTRSAVAVSTMQIGKKGGGKHWTAAQIAARQKASELLERKDDRKLLPPDWLNKEQLKIWAETMKDDEGYNLIKPKDRAELASYCISVVKIKQLSNKRHPSDKDEKTLLSHQRNIHQLADKMGFNATSRARLIKRIADEKGENEFLKEFG